MQYNFFSSWGDGEHGKLGHGTTDRVRKPKIIAGIKSKGPLVREWHQVSAGFKHSAIVTNDGKYFIFNFCQFCNTVIPFCRQKFRFTKLSKI